MIGPSSQISKILLSLLFLMIIYFIYMDINLYIRIHNYPIDRNYTTNHSQNIIDTNSNNNINLKKILTTQDPVNLLSNNNNNNIINSNIYNKNNNNKPNEGYINSKHNDKNININANTNSLLIWSDSSSTTANLNTIKLKKIEEVNYEDVVWIKCNINPLCDVTVKSLMLDHTNHYIFAPMATVFDNIIGISRTNFITPNMISFFHVFVAIAAGRLIASDSLGYRRIGVVLFQFRTFLDDLDGHVARTRKHIRGERSEIGTSGYYIDGICDGLGCIALMLGIFVFLKNNPPRRGYTQLQSIIPMINDNKTNSNGETGVIYKVHKVTTKKVVKIVLCFSGQLLLSSTGWNRYIAIYQDMLERVNVTPMQFLKQNFIFRTNLFFSIVWLWRIFNVHSLLHCILLSIFCDKLWEFLRTIQYIGYVALLIIICIAEMHILEVQKIIFESLTGANNTSL